jgi:hypothetical protein
VRLDRKLLLIAPAIVLIFAVAGMIYAAMQLNVMASVSESWKERADFIASVQRGEKSLSERQAMSLLSIQLDVESKRTAAIVASRDLLIALSAIALAACVVLLIGIRSVPREHWPRISLRRGGPD